MVKAKSKRPSTKESDGAYFLKLVLYVILGSQWIWFTNGNGSVDISLPAGFIIGLLFARHDHFQLDRKIEYAVLIIAMLIGFWSQIGLFITN